MNIALVGYGRMGRMIERIAESRGHRIIARFDIDNNAGGAGLTSESLAGVDVAIEFSVPETVVANLRRLIQLQVPAVVGTTGWYENLEEIRSLVQAHDSALVYGANFSIGMNLFLKLIERAAELFSPYVEYDPFLIEQHHKFKKDAPSGTALVMAERIRPSYSERTPSPVSVRAGHIPGTHELGFDSEADTVTLTHTARSREGFAAGAVLAAELIASRKGAFEFSDLLFTA